MMTPTLDGSRAAPPANVSAGSDRETRECRAVTRCYGGVYGVQHYNEPGRTAAVACSPGACRGVAGCFPSVVGRGVPVILCGSRDCDKVGAGVRGGVRKALLFALATTNS